MQIHFFSTSYHPSELVTLIAMHHPHWQVCFLNNDHRPVIGICPRVIWTAFFDDALVIERTHRHDASEKYLSTYTQWQEELIAYSRQFIDQCTARATMGYTHGLMGFIGYDLSAYELNRDIAIKQNQPCAYFGHYDVYLRPAQHGFELIGMNVDDEAFLDIKNNLSSLLKKTPPLPKPAVFYPSWTKDDYLNAFECIEHYIKSGDVYQINLTQKWTSAPLDLVSYFPHLVQKINAPFAAYLKLRDFEILSVSPELFFQFNKIDNHIHVMTKPIKGTRPRHDNHHVDEQLKNELANSQKDISENLMIVDLLRNDLGKYAKIGTVKTPKRFDVESFQNVHHMVSTICAQLQDVHSLTVLFGSLPAGSITGTPKKRACEIIHELETSPRGAYCGTMGYMNFDGTGSWNVLIRTLQKSQDCELWAGGGITIKSNVDNEHQECMDKIGNIIEMMKDH